MLRLVLIVQPERSITKTINAWKWAAMFTIDHLVLPTMSLDGARRRLKALGFTVAADAAHPFGTGNACVFMGDGTYLEPLSIVDQAAYDQAFADGNVFVRQDGEFRTPAGEEGLSAMALATDDAQADDARFVEAGVSAGKMLEFSRFAKLPDGTEKLARFRLAFAARSDADSFGVFTCQRLDPLPADRSALERHENGVAALSQVVLLAGNTQEDVERIGTVLDASAEKFDFGDHRFAASNAVLRLVDAKTFADTFSSAGDAASLSRTGLGRAAVIFRVPDLAVTRAVLAANDVAFMDKGSRIVVAPAPGQGAVFAFEE